MITQEDRERLALNNKVAVFRRFKKTEYKEGRLNQDSARSFHIWLKDICEDKDFYMADCLINARRKKKERVKKKITHLVGEGSSLFLTLTFRDNVFQKTSKETRRTYVRRYLKQYSDNYIANIDYGDENGREHYHAVVDGIRDLNFNDWYKSYGAIKMRHIKTKEQQADIISSYITKLTNHTIKNSTNNERLIYSRKKNI